MAYTLTDISVPEFHFDLEANTASATRVVRLEPWSELDTAINDLAGGSLSMGQLLIVTQPIKYPGKDYLWLLDIKAKPFYDCVGTADANDLPEDPAGAELTLLYRTPRFEQGQQQNHPQVPVDTYLTIERNMSLEFVSEPGQGLFWPAQQAGGDPYDDGNEFDGHPVDIDGHITSVVSVGDIRVTWHRVKNPPWATIYALQGTVNNAQFMGFAEEQVLFVGVADQQQFQTDGTDIWRLTYQFNVRIPKFKHKDVDPASLQDFWGTAGDYYAKYLPEHIVLGGWNHFPRKGATGLADTTPASPYDDSPLWQKIYRRAGTEDEPQSDLDLLFLKSDFQKLFQTDPDSND